MDSHKPSDVEPKEEEGKNEDAKEVVFIIDGKEIRASVDEGGKSLPDEYWEN